MIGAEANRLDREKTFFFIKEMMIFFKNLYNEEEGRGWDERKEGGKRRSFVVLVFFSNFIF